MGLQCGEAIGGPVYNTILGGTGLSDLAVLCGNVGTREVLGGETVLAPTTAGEFLRKFDLGEVRDLHKPFSLLLDLKVWYRASTQIQTEDGLQQQGGVR